MTIQSKRGKNEIHSELPGIHLSPTDWDIVSMDIMRMISRGAKLVGYHKRRRRSTFQYADGRIQYMLPVDRLAA